MSESKHKIDVQDENFLQETVEASKEVPIVLDFWGPTCPPCLMLAPILEALAEEYAGKFRLVKANVQEVQIGAAQFNVMGIPAVFALVNGEVVDGFQGLIPEPALRKWLDGVVAQGEILTTIKLEKEDPAAALARYQQMLADSPNETVASVGVGRMLQALGKREELAAYIAEQEKRGFLEPELTQLKAQLHVSEEANTSVDDARAAAEQNPDDLAAKYKLAESLASHGQHEEALNLCLEVIGRQTDGVGEKCRELMLDIFRVLPDDSPLTSKYRRKLSAALF